MRQLVTYAFETPYTDGLVDKVLGKLNSWLESKGEYDPSRDSLVFSDGRMATLHKGRLESSKGHINECVLTEPTSGGLFRTSVSIAANEETVAVLVGLAAASSTLSPISFDVRCPRFVRDVLSLPAQWTYRGTELESVPRDFEGETGGDDFISLVFDPERSVPVVAVSDEHGGVLHPGIIEAMAADLAGVAIVARLDPRTSWRVTSRKGKDWSCYGGAIRLYWAGIQEESASPYEHRLWTPKRLLFDMPDTEEAARRIRTELRRRILPQAAFAISEAPLFNQIRQATRREHIEALQAKAEEGTDYEQLSEELYAMLLRQEQELEERDEAIAELKARVSSLTYAVQRQDAQSSEIEPDTDVPPTTVEDAVHIAMDRFADDLVFGSDCYEGIQNLAEEAGPPQKVLDSLEALAEMSRLRKQGPLGMSALKWLEQRGVLGSGESDTIRNSPREQARRTWDDGNGQTRLFDLHLKPNDGTSPDRCVRIYFDHDEECQKTVIGWVGRHL